MSSFVRNIVMAMALVLAGVNHIGAQTESMSEDELFGRAMEYFNSSKYHEALIIFHKFDKKYALNNRIHAYMGLCHYYEWNYEQACKLLDEVIPNIGGYAPHERSIYYYAAAESHFNLQQYEQADTLYQMMLGVCYNSEKADAYYRIGFCNMFAEKWKAAKDNFEQALAYYERYRNTPDLQARIAQLRKMISGCEKQVDIEVRQERQQQIEQLMPLLLKLTKKNKTNRAPELNGQHIEQPQGQPVGNTATEGTENIGPTAETPSGQSETGSHDADEETHHGN